MTDSAPEDQAIEPSPPSGLRFESGDPDALVAWVKLWVAWHTAPLHRVIAAHDQQSGAAPDVVPPAA